jgi:hypothetical protein
MQQFIDRPKPRRRNLIHRTRRRRQRGGKLPFQRVLNL